LDVSRALTVWERFRDQEADSANAPVGNSNQGRCARPGDAAASGAGLVRGAANAGQSKLKIEDLDLAFLLPVPAIFWSVRHTVTTFGE